MTERRTYSLEEARVEGWFERLGQNSPSFEQLCAVVGPQFVAFSVIAGVRIQSLTVDRRNPGATLVEFAVGDGADSHELPLLELQRRLCAVLLEDDGPPWDGSMPELPAVADLHRVLGVKYVLLATLFGVELLDLVVGGGQEPSVRLRVGTVEEEVRVELFRDLVRARLRHEFSALDEGHTFSIERGVLDAVVVASEAGDADRVVELVGTWPGPLTMLLRTEEAQGLDPALRGELARTMMYLARAHESRGEVEAAEDALRVAVQWGQDNGAGADVFLALGRFQMARGSHGQAIGPLRRALSLGAAEVEALPLLARCYQDRGRWVASAACADRAIMKGASVEEVGPILEAAESKLGPAWRRFRAMVPPSKPPGPL